MSHWLGKCFKVSTLLVLWQILKQLAGTKLELRELTGMHVCMHCLPCEST
jgi:hypothetical protein